MYSKIFRNAITISILFLPATLLAVDPSAEELYSRIYGQANENLQNGNAEQKVLAAYVLGTQRKQKYVRPLSRELLDGLDNPILRKSSTHGPYVKSQIAWALGRIGHFQAIPSLNQALDITLKIVEEDLSVSSKKREALEQSKSPYPVVLDRDRPGPTHLKKGSRFPDSPDIYWSLADDFKADMAANPDTVDDRIKLQGYNYVNLVLSILDSIGKITGNYKNNIATGSAGEPLKKKLSETKLLLGKVLDHNLPSVRGGAALALAEIGDKESLELLDKRYQQETDFTVKTQIARAILWNDRTKSAVTQELISMLSSEDINVRLEASLALRDIGLGESLTYLQSALKIEDDSRIRTILKEAIFNAQIDNVMPVNY